MPDCTHDRLKLDVNWRSQTTDIDATCEDCKNLFVEEEFDWIKDDYVLQRRNSLPQDRANARLIAAAPSLLATLVKLKDYLSSIHESSHPLLLEAGLVIAEATGEVHGA